MGDSDYKYFFSNKGKAMISRQPRRPQQQNGPPVPKNSSRTNPFALLDEQDLDEPSDSRIRQELTLRPRAETANPNKTRFVTKHVISATQHGVQTVQKVSTLSAASSSAADTPLSSSERTANDEDDYLIGLDVNDNPIQERFRRHHRRGNDERDPIVNLFAGAQVEIARLRQYFAQVDQIRAGEPSWKTRAEYPRRGELFDEVEPWQNVDENGGVVLGANIPQGAFSSNASYLRIQYELFREEAVRPLREAVSFMKSNPFADEPPKNGNFGIYDDVRITGVTTTNMGPAVEVQFSTRRCGKKINWETSSRLMPGSVVILSCDRFATCIPAVVASRDEDKLKVNRTDLWFPHPDMLEIDPRKVFVIAEERSTFYEAQRSVMMSLQKMTGEPFPLSQLIVDGDVCLNATTAYVIEDPCMDFSELYGEGHESLNVLSPPSTPECKMDESQEQALMQILTKELAVIQGPPGTGKTFVSVQALKVMMKRWKEGDPPILIACQTNHALDQLLRHLAADDPDLNFARLGGRSKDTGVVQQRRMWELRKKLKARHPGSRLVRTHMERAERDFLGAISPLTDSKIDHNQLEFHGVITENQQKSLESGETGWVGLELKSVDPKNPLLVWLGDSAREVARVPISENFQEWEEEVLDEETIRERELEGLPDDNWEKLKGEYMPVAQEWSGGPVTMAASEAVELLTEQNLWRIRKHQRGPLYNYLVDLFKAKIVEKARLVAARYAAIVKEWRIVGMERDIVILKKQKVLGMTTTGLSKFRPLVEAISPKVLLIEEAAETLEAPVVAGCFPTLEHLILVGDHQQLRPNVGIEDLRGAPFHFDLSLFERMVNNGIDYVLLNTQRRMIPEIRSLLHPIYGDKIKDHESVLDRPDVPGMGGLNLFVHSHDATEVVDEYQSTGNPVEADMVAGFWFHLLQNGVESGRITIITFYNAQCKLIIRSIVRKLKAQAQSQDLTEDMESPNVKVITVDSYQGEENDIVLLSLVRSNEDFKIGFAGIANRICVALSRARNGFYIFGNIHMFAYSSQVWDDVRGIVQAMEGRPRIGNALPTTCTKHGTVVPIENPDGWDKLRGGCTVKCQEHLSCGHPCLLLCHPSSHIGFRCFAPCEKILLCSHRCSMPCMEPCMCKPCSQAKQAAKAGPRPLPPANVAKNAPSYILVKGTVNASPAAPAVPTGPRGMPGMAPAGAPSAPRTWPTVASRGSGSLSFASPAAPSSSRAAVRPGPRGTAARRPEMHAPSPAANYFASLAARNTAASASSDAATFRQPAALVDVRRPASPTPAQAALSAASHPDALKAQLQQPLVPDKPATARTQPGASAPTATAGWDRPGATANTEEVLWISDEAEALLSGSATVAAQKSGKAPDASDQLIDIS